MSLEAEDAPRELSLIRFVLSNRVHSHSSYSMNTIPPRQPFPDPAALSQNDLTHPQLTANDNGWFNAATAPAGHTRRGYVSPSSSPTYKEYPFQDKRDVSTDEPLPAFYPFPNLAYPAQAPFRRNVQDYSNGTSGIQEVQPRRKSSGGDKRKASKKTDGKQPTFLAKLYQ